MPRTFSTEIFSNSSLDIKANGEVSRMRSHKGNMPSLPQTKYCTLCPAKFTRTTHLNRHLRSHTNERAHRCTTCSAEFTRSDLLTRHKRTCGDSNANRSRRKSCQACAESKVKCNLEVPCSKCTARGRECIFINDPEASRKRKCASKKSSRSSTSPSESDLSESSSRLDSLGPSSPSSTVSFLSHGCEDFSHLVSPPNLTAQLQPNSAFGPFRNNTSDTSSGCSSRSSPQLDQFDPRQNISDAFAMGFDMLEVDSELNNFFPNVLEPFSQDPYSPCHPRVQTELDLASWLDANQVASALYGNNEPLYSQQLPPFDQDFVAGLTTLPPSSSNPSISSPHFSTNSPVNNSIATFGASSGLVSPTTEDLDFYLCLFFTEFNTQVPLFHRPSWKVENTHPILIRAMQACGAVLAKTPTSMSFVIKTLTRSRETLLAEFSKPTCTLKDHMHLLLAVVLLQSIGLLHPRPEQRGLSKVYHDILVMMIRKTGLIKLTGSWHSPDLSNQALLDNMWRDWARHETFKRALALAYIQDCSYCMYYSAPPSFHPSEFDINLPCDDALWRAQTALEWHQIQRTPSSYGSGLPRIQGVSMQQAISCLREPSQTLMPFRVNPFASFVLVNTIIRDVFSAPSAQHSGNAVTIQCALHNWQRMWSSSPEAVQSEKYSAGTVPFVCNASPLYWVARFAEAAKQNGSMHAGVPLASRGEVDDRFRTIKLWLGQINASLNSAGQNLPSPIHVPSWQQLQLQHYQNHGSPPPAVGIPVFS